VEYLSLLLSPLSEAMRLLLVLFARATGSYGIAVILLGVTVRLLTAPVTRFAGRAAARDRQVQAAMAGELGEIRRTSKGRERFERTEALYRRHGYHPMKSVASLLPLLLNIPFLLAALILLSTYPPLAGTPFLVLADLSEPDRLLAVGGGTINLLPLLITAVTLSESLVDADATRASRLRFLVIGLVIAALIYPMPAGVCLYWFTGNVLSFLGSAARRLKGRDGGAP
jgi:YidC/Oxa1 family membrane protein insertase